MFDVLKCLNVIHVGISLLSYNSAADYDSSINLYNSRAIAEIHKILNF